MNHHIVNNLEKFVASGQSDDPVYCPCRMKKKIYGSHRIKFIDLAITLDPKINETVSRKVKASRK